MYFSPFPQNSANSQQKNNQGQQNQQKKNQNDYQTPLAIGPYLIDNKIINILKKYYNMHYGVTPEFTGPFTLPSPPNREIGNENQISYVMIKKKDKINPKVVCENLVSFSGTQFTMKSQDNQFVNTPIMIMKMPGNQALRQKIFETMVLPNENQDLLKRKLFNNFTDTLNLSSFWKYIPEANFNEEGVLDFILFLCAKFSYMNNHNVIIINCSNNNLNSIDLFVNAKNIFPNLQNIILEGNPIQKSYFNVFNKIQSMGVSIQLSTGGFNKSTRPDSMQFEEPEVEEIIPPQLATNDYEPEPIELDSDEFMNPILIAMFESYENNIEEIGRYYHDDAVMSVTSEIGQDIEIYQSFSRSLIHSRDNIASGIENVVEFNKELFGEHVSFQILSMQFSEIDKDRLFLDVLHGQFIDRRNIKIGFDRSLLIYHEGDDLVITNDQIHFRTA